jgi:Tfp pilus assembly protein PilW
MKIPLATRASQKRKFRYLGMTLPEMMVATSVGMLVMAVVATLFVTSSRSFAAIGNYVGMDANSRNALDHMTQDIRQAGNLTEFSPTHLAFTALGQTNSFLVYNWDSGTRCLTQWKTGDTTTNTLLTDCGQLTFSLYNSAFAPTTNILEGKGLSVNWTCSRLVIGQQNTSEDMQQALIVIRNKPL